MALNARTTFVMCRAAVRTMLKRPGSSQEVANCIHFLASEEASYVTGTLLFVDGGMTSM